MPVCPVAPRVSVSPGTVEVSQPTLAVTATAEDENIDGDPNSFRVYLDGVDVTAAWGYSTEAFGWGTGRGTRFIARATITLSEAAPARTVMVRLCDTTECTTQSATYTLHLPGVEVGPDGTAVTVSAAGTRTAAFTVTNRGTVAATFPLTPSCRQPETGGTVSCSVSPTSLSLSPGASGQATVTYAATSVGVPLAVTLSARHATEPGVQDAGWVDVTVHGTGGGQAAPVVQLVDLNSGPQIDRGQCVTASAGAGAAYECGDLRLVHALPAIGTAGKSRAPVLIYNSQHAHARPLVYADVTLPAGANAPDSVIATLVLADGRTVRRAYAGGDWKPGTTRRVAVQWNALGDGTQLFAYTLQVANLYAGTQYPSGTLNGEVAVVNRYAATIGAGWWVAGVEQLVCVNCASGGSRLLWVGGDGSTRVYEPTVPGAWTTWTAQQPDGPPDTLTLAASQYTRRLRGGGEIHFDGGGRHVRTVNRLGHVTTFAYDAQSRLQAIYPPTWREALWWFTRDPGTGALLNVCAHVAGVGCRYTTVDRDASGRVAGLQDPDGHWVRFGHGGAAPSFQVLTRTDRRGTVTSFAYDAAGKLASVKLPLAPGDTITTRYAAAEGKGFAASVGSSEAFTLLDGPRTDVADETRIWVTRWGAPSRIRDALGAETRIRRTDTFFPALPTEVIAPNGLRTEARYDARGRVDTTVVHNPLDSNPAQNAVTTYAYDDRWDRPTRISAPLVGSVTMAYDPANGNVLWQQQGSSSTRRVIFRYYGAGTGAAAGQLRAVQHPADAQGLVAVDSLWYDSQGNLEGTRSPLGFLTLHYRDLIGRDTLTVTPTTAAGATSVSGLLASGVRQRTEYDAMSRPWRTRTVGPAMQHVTTGGIIPLQTGVDTLVVETQYNPEGQPLEVRRWASPDTARVHILSTTYDYDPAGRKKWESDGFVTNTYVYDHAGNVTAWTTPRGHQIRTEYDALGRVERRVVPAVSYAHECPSNTNPCTNPYPHHPNGSAGSLLIPEEWTFFRYDAAGNQVYAENADAIVQRSYYRNGALKGDTLRIRGFADGSFDGHVYGLEHAYDIAGRPVSLKHPQVLAGAQHTDRWWYHPVTGALDSLQTRLGHRFSWTYDNTGRPIASNGQGGITETLRYDVEGRLVRRTETGTLAGTLHADSLIYDARGKLMQVNVGPTSGRNASTYRQWYSGSGMLIGTDWQNESDNGRVQEAFGMDAMGNTAWRRSGDGSVTSADVVFRNWHAPGRGALERIEWLNLGYPSSQEHPEETTRTYDASGNVQWGVNSRTGFASDGVTQVIVRDMRNRSYYAADERLRYYQERDMVLKGTSYTLQGVWEEYRYDPLGRRVLVNTRRKDLCTDANAFLCASATTRMVWAGDQLLWEIRGPSESPGETAGPAAAYGTVGYAHAGGIDRPLSITKDGVTVIPHQNWRGQFSRGTYASGAQSDCPPGVTTGCTPIPWPGYRTTAWHVGKKELDIRNWYGGLVDGMRDASGQMYMRNRYYDPATGQFTQTDPIGLAGGLNAYGFAAGDPVSYSDPYGLCVTVKNEKGERVESDCERFAKYVEQLARESRSDHEFVDRLAETVAGIQGGDLRNVGSPSVTFGNSGFRSELVDDSNPARHYSAYVAAGYKLGAGVGAGIAVYRELPGVCAQGCSVEDVRLGVIGSDHGQSLRPDIRHVNWGMKPPSRADLAKRIREDL